MHAPLGVPERQLVCADLIVALQECHAKGILYRWSGKCNAEKQALTMCLRQERLDRTARNREEAKERTARKKDAWALLERETLAQSRSQSRDSLGSEGTATAEAETPGR